MNQIALLYGTGGWRRVDLFLHAMRTGALRCLGNIFVIQHVRPKYACKPCEENVKIAAMPALLLPKSIATPELVAHVIISTYCDHLPLDRQEAMWQRMDIENS